VAGGCGYDTAVRAILDTNVLVAGLKSALGASHWLISLVKAGQVRPAVTTPLAVEY
jgi:predicted nucleic acid-binding protein